MTKEQLSSKFVVVKAKWGDTTLLFLTAAHFGRTARMAFSLRFVA